MKKQQLNANIKAFEKFRINNINLIIGGGDTPPIVTEGDEEEEEEEITWWSIFTSTQQE